MDILSGEQMNISEVDVLSRNLRGLYYNESRPTLIMHIGGHRWDLDGDKIFLAQIPFSLQNLSDLLFYWVEL